MNRAETRWPVPIKIQEGVEWAGNLDDIAALIKAGGELLRRKARKPRKVAK